jgi:alcohol dehydrogenase class IV
MENIQEFYMPVRIFMGRGAIRTLPDVLGVEKLKRVLIVTDSGLKRAGIIDGVCRALGQNCSHVTFSGVEPNPTTETVNEAYRVWAAEKCEGVLAVGGGSSIDTGKGVAILGANGGNIEDYSGTDVFRNPPAPLFVVPTTVGSGSEVTKAAVIVDRRLKKKLVIRGKNSFARAAFLDPELLRSLP